MLAFLFSVSQFLFLCFRLSALGFFLILHPCSESSLLTLAAAWLGQRVCRKPVLKLAKLTQGHPVQAALLFLFALLPSSHAKHELLELEGYLQLTGLCFGGLNVVQETSRWPLFQGIRVYPLLIYQAVFWRFGNCPLKPEIRIISRTGRGSCVTLRICSLFRCFPFSGSCVRRVCLRPLGRGCCICSDLKPNLANGVLQLVF